MRIGFGAGAAVWLLPLSGLLAVRPLQDPDLWWHLVNGRLMAETGDLTPVYDRAFTLPATVRVNPSWLWDRLV